MTTHRPVDRKPTWDCDMNARRQDHSYRKPARRTGRTLPAHMIRPDHLTRPRTTTYPTTPAEGN